MATSSEKTVPPLPPAPSPPASSYSSYFNPVSPFFNAYDRFSSWRRDLGLPHPGSVENLGKEVKGMS
jgi:mitochondrial import receptor subunit TOM40